MNPNNFNVSTDYPPDYVLFPLQRNYTIDGSSPSPSSLDTIPHSLPFAPLVDGVWGFTHDLSDARSIVDNYGPNLTSMASLIIEVSSDENNIYIYCDNYEFPYTIRTFYFKLWCYINPSWLGAANPSNDNTNYMFNSDFNYIKLFTASNTTIASSSSIDIMHNLGFRPRSLVWIREDFGFTPNNTFQQSRAELFTDRIRINNSFSSSPKEVSYRIYANE